MGIADAIPPIRVQFRGPVLNNGITIENFCNFMMKQQKNFEDITPYLSNPEKLSLVFLYIEGSFLIHKLLPSLTEPLCAQLLANYKSLGNPNIARLTQALVSSGTKIESESLKKLLTMYFQQNYESKTFSTDIKANLSRIVKLADLDVRELKTQIEADISNPQENLGRMAETKNIAASQAELYINSILEIEGKNLSEDSRQNIIKIIVANTNPRIDALSAVSLERFGITVEDEPLIWKAIASNLKQIEDQPGRMEVFKESLTRVGYAGYRDPLFWKETKDLIMKEQKRLDCDSTIAIRNMFVKIMPDEKAFITFLEQKTISILFMFGKTSRIVLNHELHNEYRAKLTKNKGVYVKPDQASGAFSKGLKVMQHVKRVVK